VARKSICFSGDANTNLTGYMYGFDFGAAEDMVSIGRYCDQPGEEEFVAQAALTLRTNNAGPEGRPVVINEIMYHPLALTESDNWTDEFLELRNITGAEVNLFDRCVRPTPGVCATRWTSISRRTTTLPAGGYLLVVGFRSRDHGLAYGLPGQIRRARGGAASSGPWSGRLDMRGTNVELYKPR